MEEPGPKKGTQINSVPVKVTVFTATYNRKQKLERAYQNLKKQTFNNFEWLIIDDGSTDGTENLVNEWVRESNYFPIRYRWKLNGGKHTAHNLAISLAEGEYFAILDSDDWYAPEALAILTAQWDSMSIEAKKEFSNIEGLCLFENGTLAGQLFPRDVYDSDNYAIKTNFKRPMDTRGMYRIEVLKEFPFPTNYDGCYVPESLIWNRIAEKYRTRFINQIIGFIEYQPDGLTRRSIKAGLAKSEPAVLYNWELSKRKFVPFKERLKCKANVYRYSFHNRLPIGRQFKKEESKLCEIPFIFLGYLNYLKDRVAVLMEDTKRQ